MKQLTKDHAIAFGKNRCWIHLSDRQIAEFQTEQELLCVDPNIYKRAVEITVGHPLLPEAFVLNPEGIRTELFKNHEPLELEDILAALPEEKYKSIMKF